MLNVLCKMDTNGMIL